jgi:hypothetical protein
MTPTRNYFIRLIGILIIALLRMGFIGEAIGRGEVSFWALLDTTLLAAILIWESSRLVVMYFHRRYVLSQLTVRRFLEEALCLLAVDSLLFFSRAVLLELWLHHEPIPLAALLYGLFYTFLFGVLVAGFYEFLLYVRAWKKVSDEAEQLKKANLMSQLDSLKNQVKPHFLFNSLNTLAALVDKDASKAKKFIAQLAKVYRYLLQSNEKGLISLQEEISFTEAYFFLLQTRFGQGIGLEIDVEERYLSYQIPPLTLQMLVENAVKHNQVSINTPLQVSITIVESRWLVVSNNLQPKRGVVPSNGIGLSNILTKYKLLNQPGMQVLKEEKHFYVKLPLIPSR